MTFSYTDCARNIRGSIDQYSSPVGHLHNHYFSLKMCSICRNVKLVLNKVCLSIPFRCLVYFFLRFFSSGHEFFTEFTVFASKFYIHTHTIILPTVMSELHGQLSDWYFVVIWGEIMRLDPHEMA